MSTTNPYLQEENESADAEIAHYGITAYSHKKEIGNFNAFSEAMLVKTNAYFQSKKYYEGKEISSSSNWLILIILCCVGMVSFLRAFHRKRLDLIFKTLFNWKLGKQIIRYEKVYTHPVNLGLLLVFLISTSLYFSHYYVMIKHYDIDFFALGALLFSSLLAFFLVKFLLYQFSAWLFEEQERITEYIFHVALVNKFIGIIMLILSVLSIYSSINSSWIFTIALSTIGIALLVQIGRGFRIGAQKSKDLIMIILYLCTLEILPLFVVSKMVISKL